MVGGPLCQTLFTRFALFAGTSRGFCNKFVIGFRDSFPYSGRPPTRTVEWIYAGYGHLFRRAQFGFKASEYSTRQLRIGRFQYATGLRMRCRSLDAQFCLSS